MKFTLTQKMLPLIQHSQLSTTKSWRRHLNYQSITMKPLHQIQKTRQRKLLVKGSDFF